MKIPEPGEPPPECGFYPGGGGTNSMRSSRNLNKNKGIRGTEARRGLVVSVHCMKNVDAFHITVFTGFRARGKGLALRLVLVVPTCL